MHENVCLEKDFEIGKLADLKSQPIKQYEKLEKSNSYLYQSFLLNSELNNQEEDIENTFIVNPNTNIILKEDLEKMFEQIQLNEIENKNQKDFFILIKNKIAANLNNFNNLNRINKRNPNNFVKTHFSLDYIVSIEKAKQSENNIEIRINNYSGNINSNINDYDADKIEQDDFNDILKKKAAKPKKKTTASIKSDKGSDISRNQNPKLNTSNTSNKNNNNCKKRELRKKTLFKHEFG